MLPADVRDHCADHLGLVTRPVLLRLGHGEGTVEGWVRRGHLETVQMGGRRLWGTYRVPGGAQAPGQLPYAGALRCRPRARVTGPFVLGALGVEGFCDTDPFAVIVPAGRRVQRVPFLVLTDRAARPDRARIGPIPIATVSRALVDTALWVSGKRLRVAFDSARFKGLTNQRRLRACAREVRHRGARSVLDLLDSGVLDLDSEAERALAPVLDGLEPQWQHWVLPHRRVDCLLRHVPLVIEYLGEVAHGGAEQRRQDHARDRELRARGYHIEYVTKDDLRHPEVLRARILGARDALLARATPQPTLHP